MHYSSKHFDQSRSCQRLFVFCGNIDTIWPIQTDEFEEVVKELETRFIGCIVVRPLQIGKIGKSIFSPKYFLDFQADETTMVRVANYRFSMYGVDLEIAGFPYMMQDSETITCTEVTAILLLDYYGRTYPDYRIVMPSEIIDAISEAAYERSLPSRGLTYNALTRVLKQFGFAPRLYDAKKISDNNLKSTLYAYVESAIPVAVALEASRPGHPGHSIVCIGHGNRNIAALRRNVRLSLHLDDAKPQADIGRLYYANASDAYEHYVFMDDCALPYKVSELEGTHLIGYDADDSSRSITSLSVPLNRRMAMEAMDAQLIFHEILNSDMGLTSFLKQKTNNAEALLHEAGLSVTPGTTEQSPLIMRTFLATSRSFKRFRTSHSKSKSIFQKYRTLQLPRFIWICELYTIDSFENNCAVGEIVLDATSAICNDCHSVILIHYPGYIAIRGRRDRISNITGVINELQEIDDWLPFDSFTFNTRYPQM